MNILVPKYKKGKRPVRVRKPSRPLDGINHRLLKEQAAKSPEVEQEVRHEIVQEIDDNAPPTRIELVAKATELGLKFSKRTSDEKLLDMITEALSKQEA